MNQQTFAWFHSARQWDLTPTEELPPIGLEDTQVLPAVTEDAFSPVDEAAEKERAADVAVGGQHQPEMRPLDPQDPAELDVVLAALRRWTP